jgi:hypothetical protein
MPHTATRRQASKTTGKPRTAVKETRFTVGLAPQIADRVEHYAKTVDISMSRAIATLVRIGLENQESRKREFFQKLKENLADDSPERQDRLVEEFRALILGH